jgi:hypothetical protein
MLFAQPGTYLRPGTEIKLLQDPRYMGCRSVFGDSEIGRDLTVSASHRNLELTTDEPGW